MKQDYTRVFTGQNWLLHGILSDIFHQLTNGFVVSDETTVPELMAISPFKGIYRAATAVTMLSKRIVLFAPFDT